MDMINVKAQYGIHDVEQDEDEEDEDQSEKVDAIDVDDLNVKNKHYRSTKNSVKTI